jgi:hypothetical protein
VNGKSRNWECCKALTVYSRDRGSDDEGPLHYAERSL